MTGYETELVPQTAVATLRVSNLRKSFIRTAVDGLDLTVPPGEFFALLGPNGAGKTTTLRMVAGLLRPDAGAIEICGVDALAHPLAARQMVAWLPEEPLLYELLTPLEYLEFVAGLWRVDPPHAEALGEELLRRLGLWPHRDERCGGFSRGMRQKTVLAGALLHEPKLLILDEPLTGLDASAARDVKDLLAARVADGATIVLTTHILEVAERLASRIGIITAGRLLAIGTMDELRARAGSTSGATLEDVFLHLIDESRLSPLAADMTASAQGQRGLVILPPGSTLWLAWHELRLQWRGSILGRAGGRWLVIGIAAGIQALGVVFAMSLLRVRDRIPITDPLLSVGVVLALTTALMMAQSVQRATEVLDGQADLGWLLSSPLPPRRILAVRLISVSFGVVFNWMLIVAPVANGLILLGHTGAWRVYPVVAAMALVATATGFGLTFSLLRVLGTKRTRAVANGAATLIGATAFLTGQSRTLLSQHARDALWTAVMPIHGAQPPGLGWWPARALLEGGWRVAGLVTIGLSATALASLGLQQCSPTARSPP